MYLILGRDGQLGQCFRVALQEAHLAYQAPSEQDADILSVESLSKAIEQARPSFVINCAAYTDVEKAEDDPGQAYAINAQGPRNIGLACKKLGIPCVHFSTDYVFDGNDNRPYTEDDIVNPGSVYAKSKQQGEDALLETGADCLIFRTSWLYSPYGRNFYATMRKLGQERSNLKIVMDQLGTPTYAPYLVRHILDILPQFQPNHTGIYHLGDEGVASWYDFAYQIMHMENLPCAVHPILSREYPTKAQRPAYSVLSKEKVKKTFEVRLSHWTEGVHSCHQNFQKTS